MPFPCFSEEHFPGTRLPCVGGGSLSCAVRDSLASRTGLPQMLCFVTARRFFAGKYCLYTVLFSYLCALILNCRNIEKREMKKESQTIFDKNVVEFVTVAAEFCAFLERAEQMDRGKFVDTVLKILPLLYLKASLLPPCETMGEAAPETYVTEDTYEVLRMNLAGLLGEKDDYLEVFLPDMAYSDQPIRKNISEDLADIYQDIKDFIFVFQLGLNETMNDALAICQENFKLYWGQKLVNTMRALHDVKYNQADDEAGEQGAASCGEHSHDCHCHEEGCDCGDDDCHCHHNPVQR